MSATNQTTTHLYVATNGKDTWPGTLPEPNATGTDGPLATLRRARDAVRGLRDAEGRLPGPVTVRVRGGTCFPHILTRPCCVIALGRWPGRLWQQLDVGLGIWEA